MRNGEIAVTKQIINLTLCARDLIREMLDSSDGRNPVDEVKTRDLVSAFRKLIADNGEEKEATKSSITSSSNENAVSPDSPGENITYRIRFRPANDIFMNGTNPICLLAELRELGECKIVAQIDAIPQLEDIKPEFCYTYWDVILTTRQGINAIKDVFMFVEDSCELNITIIDDTGGLESEEDYKKIGEILIERGDITEDDLQKVLGNQKPIGEMLVEEGLTTHDRIQSALVEQQHVKEVRTKRQSTEQVMSIRVPSAKLDSFVDLVGELVIVQARLSETAVNQNNSELRSIAEEVEQLTAELRDCSMSIRLMPIGSTFSKFKRLVRDLSNELGREIEMITDGAETELDKTVIEKLNDPLVHLIRNSIDHGIEPPEIREANGKPRVGTVSLSAVHSGSNVLIRIKDDGMGLDAEAIRARAIEKGLIMADSQLTEKELFAQIFAPGFSTAKKVTSVSGRGVGMDVVKRAIDSLRGTIEVSSQCGVGTTITIKLPLTLAIIEGLLVEISGECFVVPLSLVEECVELTHNDVVNSKGTHIANVRGEIVPYIYLRDWFMIVDESPAIEQIVIVEMDGNRVGFVVDHIIGEHQTVIKTLGKVYKDVQGVSGATILGDGRVALILDIPQLVQEVESSRNDMVSELCTAS